MTKCKNCKYLIECLDVSAGEEIEYKWCPVKDDCPDIERERDCDEYECMTNADRIRSMTDEELAEFLKECIASTGENMFLCCEYEKTEHCIGHMCTECGAYLAWLKSEVGCE